MKATVSWQGKMAFSASDGSNTLNLDAPASVGGDNQGFRPKQLMLDALGGCTAMDVISILKKMQQEPKSFRVEVEASESEEHPKVFTAFKIHYYISGDVDEKKLQKAIDLSQDRYCGVSAMLRQVSTIEHTYTIER